MMKKRSRADLVDGGEKSARTGGLDQHQVDPVPPQQVPSAPLSGLLQPEKPQMKKEKTESLKKPMGLSAKMEENSTATEKAPNKEAELEDARNSVFRKYYCSHFDFNFGKRTLFSCVFNFFILEFLFKSKLRVIIRH